MAFPEAQSPVAVAPPEDDTIEFLQRRVAGLAEAVAARDTFIAVAAHELRNPMTPIIGQIDLMLRAVRAGRCPQDQVEQRLVRIQHTMHRYVKRAEILLDVSRINSGRLQLEPEAFDLAALLRDVAEEFAEAARHAGVAVTVTAPESLPVCLDRLASNRGKTPGERVFQAG
jgi:two-component system OmpR family sensor kinase